MRRLKLLSPALVAFACSATAPNEDPFNLTATAADTGVSGGGGDDASSGEDESSSGGVDPSGSTGQTTTPLDTTGDDESSESSGGDPDVCGDGIIGPTEACEGTDFGEESCVTQGFMSGELVCSADCSGFATDGCYICGDGAVQSGEQCDTVLPDDITCEGEGFTEGDISCNFATCQFDVSACSLCGNGEVEGNEACDADDLAGASCLGLGFDGGDLACAAATCGYDYAGCQGGQYSQSFEGGALPPEFSLGGNADWDVTMTNPIAGSWSAANGDIVHNETSSLFLTVLFSVPGTAAFTHEESTESCCDYLRFYVDGAEQGEWSGTNAAAPASFNVAAGMHELEWRYSKDFSVDSGSDMVWVDDIVITDGVPTP